MSAPPQPAPERLRFAIARIPDGFVLTAESAAGVCAIFMGDTPGQLISDLQQCFPSAQLTAADADRTALPAFLGWLDTPDADIPFPLDIRGTPFQRRVWEALAAIPAGRTATYTEIARLTGNPQAVRAVAGACAANRLAFVIPCHRVIRSGGALSGYRWGVERKRRRLFQEKASRPPGPPET